MNLKYTLVYVNSAKDIVINIDAPEDLKMNLPETWWSTNSVSMSQKAVWGETNAKLSQYDHIQAGLKLYSLQIDAIEIVPSYTL